MLAVVVAYVPPKSSSIRALSRTVNELTEELDALSSARLTEVKRQNMAKAREARWEGAGAKQDLLTEAQQVLAASVAQRAPQQAEEPEMSAAELRQLLGRRTH